VEQDFFHQHYLHGLVHVETGLSTVNHQRDFNQKKLDINSVLAEQMHAPLSVNGHLAVKVGG